LPDFGLEPGETIRERVLKIKVRARNEFLIWQVYIVFLLVFGAKLVKEPDPLDSKFVVLDES